MDGNYFLELGEWSGEMFNIWKIEEKIGFFFAEKSIFDNITDWSEKLDCGEINWSIIMIDNS